MKSRGGGGGGEGGGGGDIVLVSINCILRSPITGRYIW